MKTNIVLLVLAAALCGACDEKSSGSASETPVTSAPAATSAAPPATASAAAAPATASAAAVAKVPTEEDFEAKATTTVTPTSVDGQLNDLDKEIGQ
jgi:hypothetical protein